MIVSFVDFGSVVSVIRTCLKPSRRARTLIAQWLFGLIGLNGCSIRQLSWPLAQRPARTPETQDK